MRAKTLKASICFIIPLLIVGAFILHTAGADTGAEAEPIDLLKSKQLYGPLKLVEPHEIDVNKDLTYYEDNNYRYSVQEGGKILSLIRLANAPVSSEKALTREQAVAVTEKMITNILPEFNSSSYDVIVEQSDGEDTPWRVFHRLINEKGIIFGQISTFIDRDGEVWMLSADIYPEKIDDNSLQKNNMVIEEKAIAIAYQAVEGWAGEQDFALNTEDKESHTVTASQYYDADYSSICWIVHIENVEKIINPQKALHQSFLVTINAQTGEVLNLSPSR
ncbi:MAG TPA: hypothetical protein DG577_05675 [Firmicutes bacterium]|jgi:hypothetical protein|nr:hypothetical protein [Bacillota bacterium]HCX78880.1 hypothetical protein [Bacillota bacterium]